MGNLPIIYTKHAQDRMKLRRIQPYDVAQILAQPDSRIEQSDPPDSVKFTKVIDDRRLQIVATYLKKEQSWLVISVWAKGEDDPKDQFTTITLGFFKLFWWLIKRIATLLTHLGRK